MGTRLLGILGTADGKGVVRVQDSVDASIETVWSAITDPARLAGWWGEVEGNLQLGGEYRERVFASGWEGTGRVEACEAPRRLLLHREPDQPDEQAIEITLTADGDQTVVVWEACRWPISPVTGPGSRSTSRTSPPIWRDAGAATQVRGWASCFPLMSPWPRRSARKPGPLPDTRRRPVFAAKGDE
jgi:uncharacterized protein YndB with AHSA1/START domain